MSDLPALKLVKMETPAQNNYYLERRRALRHATSGRVTAVAHEKSPAGERNRICSLQLVNMSDTGLGVHSQEGLELDTTVAIFFPPHGAERGFDMIGKVVRSRRLEDGHEIGIHLETRAAA